MIATRRTTIGEYIECIKFEFSKDKLIPYRLVLFGLFFVLNKNTYSQSYALSPVREMALGSLGLSMNLTSYLLAKKTSVLSMDNIQKLNRNDLDILDRTATYNYSTTARKASDALLIGGLGIPLLCLIDSKAPNDIPERGVIVLQTYLLTVGLTSITKTLVKRTRPYVYNDLVPMHDKLNKDARVSFFSGHTSITASSTFLTATMLTANGRNENISPVIWASAATIPAIQGLLRWKAGKHFPSDIAIGYFVGAVVGIVIPKIHQTTSSF